MGSLDTEDVTVVFCSFISSSSEKPVDHDDQRSSSSGSSGDGSGFDFLDERDEEAEIRVGAKYQAVIPPLRPKDSAKRKRHEGYPDETDLCIWRPPNRPLTLEELDYLNAATLKHKFSEEQALGLLFWNDYNAKLSMQELEFFNSKEEWSREEESIFDHAIRSYGKSFHKIKDELPGKSLGQIFQLYYGTKKLRVKPTKFLSPAKPDSEIGRQGASTNSPISRNGTSY